MRHIEALTVRPETASFDIVEPEMLYRAIIEIHTDYIGLKHDYFYGRHFLNGLRLGILQRYGEENHDWRIVFRVLRNLEVRFASEEDRNNFIANFSRDRMLIKLAAS